MIDDLSLLMYDHGAAENQLTSATGDWWLNKSTLASVGNQVWRCILWSTWLQHVLLLPFTLTDWTGCTYMSKKISVYMCLLCICMCVCALEFLYRWENLLKCGSFRAATNSFHCWLINPFFKYFYSLFSLLDLLIYVIKWGIPVGQTLQYNCNIPCWILTGDLCCTSSILLPLPTFSRFKADPELDSM